MLVIINNVFLYLSKTLYQQASECFIKESQELSSISAFSFNASSVELCVLFDLCLSIFSTSESANVKKVSCEKTTSASAAGLST